MWKFNRVKTGTPIITFSTPESLEAILYYLKLDPPASLESPIFRSRKFKEKPLSQVGFAKQFQTIMKDVVLVCLTFKVNLDLTLLEGNILQQLTMMWEYRK